MILLVFNLFWWPWQPPEMMRRISPNIALRASLNATGCHLRASFGDVSPRGLPWSSMLLWLCRADGHKTHLLAITYHTKQWTDQLSFLANERTIRTWPILMMNVQYSIWRPSDVIRSTNTKSSMLSILLSVGEVQMFISDSVLDKNSVQIVSAN
jgi:hypothetical protein